MAVEAAPARARQRGAGRGVSATRRDRAVRRRSRAGAAPVAKLLCTLFMRLFLRWVLDSCDSKKFSDPECYCHTNGASDNNADYGALFISISNMRAKRSRYSKR